MEGDERNITMSDRKQIISTLNRMAIVFNDKSFCIKESTPWFMIKPRIESLFKVLADAKSFLNQVPEYQSELVNNKIKETINIHIDEVVGCFNDILELEDASFNFGYEIKGRVVTYYAETNAGEKIPLNIAKRNFYKIIKEKILKH